MIRRRIRLFKTYRKKQSKKVDICYRDYPDEENFDSETIINLDYKDLLIFINRHLAKDENGNEIYVYGIFEFDKKNCEKRYLTGQLENISGFNSNQLQMVLRDIKKIKRNERY